MRLNFSRGGESPRIALVLSGGNALGAYQAGAYQALHEHRVPIDRISGASAGALNGALICGNPPDARLSRLRELWRPAEDDIASWQSLETVRRTQATLATLVAGEPRFFKPRALLGSWWNPWTGGEPASLYDATPLSAMLERLVDFDMLNRGNPRFCATAVDIESGEDVVFDTTSHRITAEHVRASCALLPVFPPVEVGGRMLGDAGVSANLPLDAVLGDAPEHPLLCIAVDLVPLRGPRPRTLGETAMRAEDLIFATQSRRSVAAWQAILAERARQGSKASVTVLHIAYSDQSREVSGKAFDFSSRSAGARWHAGHADMKAALEELAAGNLAIGEPGLTAYSLAREDGLAVLRRVEWQLAPISG